MPVLSKKEYEQALGGKEISDADYAKLARAASGMNNTPDGYTSTKQPMGSTMPSTKTSRDPSDYDGARLGSGPGRDAEGSITVYGSDDKKHKFSDGAAFGKANAADPKMYGSKPEPPLKNGSTLVVGGGTAADRMKAESGAPWAPAATEKRAPGPSYAGAERSASPPAPPAAVITSAPAGQVQYAPPAKPVYGQGVANMPYGQNVPGVTGAMQSAGVAPTPTPTDADRLQAMEHGDDYDSIIARARKAWGY